jgi:EAL domain-containing protein (putative c-di-GMP-specific phosphodiesterase class I)
MIGQRMLEQIVLDMRAWLDAGLEFGSVALNLATAEFAGAGPLSRILCELSRLAVPPLHLEVEVTESVFLAGRADSVKHTLAAFNEAGISVALDDFGTGYASLTHLKQFSVDTLKIDRSFVADLLQNPDSAAIASSVIGLGRSLAKNVVAEGIETLDQVHFLADLGCEVGQGFLFSKPLPASRVPIFLSQWQFPAATHERPARPRRKA